MEMFILYMKLARPIFSPLYLEAYVCISRLQLLTFWQPTSLEIFRLYGDVLF
jgi:hypothetical protein